MSKYTLFIHKQFYVWLNFILGETKLWPCILYCFDYSAVTSLVADWRNTSHRIIVTSSTAGVSRPIVQYGSIVGTIIQTGIHICQENRTKIDSCSVVKNQHEKSTNFAFLRDRQRRIKYPSLKYSQHVTHTQNKNFLVFHADFP